MPALDARASPAPLLDRYLEIERVARHMLDAGRAGNWARVGELESTVRNLADCLAQAAGRNALSPAEDRERLRILRRIVLVDGDLRRLAQPSNAWLDDLFSSGRRSDGVRGPA